MLAVLRKLPFSLPRLSLRRRGTVDDDDDQPSRVRAKPPRGPTIAAAAVLLGFIALVVWLYRHGPETVEARAKLVPTVVVAVENATAATEGGGSTGGSQAPAAPAKPVEPPPPRHDAHAVLVPAPVPGMVEDSKLGPLPRMALDGRMPWQVYARPFPPNVKQPRIALVIADMGLSGATTGLVIEKLPGPVTLAFVPYAQRLEAWVDKARGSGHEVMLAVPMEPKTYPRDDPGPNTLLTTLGTESNIERLEWALGRVTGYIGIVSLTGSKFMASHNTLLPVLENLKRRGLLFLDSRATGNSNAANMAAHINLARAAVDRQIDRDPARAVIDEELRLLEETARRNGVAVGLGLPFPTTIERLTAWIPTLYDKGIVLAPLSAVANVQKYE